MSRLLKHVKRCPRSSHSLKKRAMSNQSQQLSRKELHELALKKTQEYHVQKAEEFKTEHDVFGVSIPEFLKFHFADTVEEREYKRRQQAYYYYKEKYGFLDDILVTKGAASREKVDAERELLAKSLESMQHLTDQLNAPTVSINQLKYLEEQYNIPMELRLEENDPREEQQRKIKKQVKLYIDTSKEALSKLPTSREEVDASLEELRQIQKQTDDPEEVLMEYEEELKELEHIDEDEMDNRLESLRKRATAASAKMELDQWTKSKALEKLGLIRRGTLNRLETELKRSLQLGQKRSEEYALRYGEMPKLDDDPYLLEYEDQLAFRAQRVASRKVNQAESQIASGGADDSEAATEAVSEAEEGDDDLDEGLTEKQETQARYAVQDKEAYNFNRKKRVFLSSEETDGAEWPKVVHGLELSKFEHLRDVPYEKFEDPPNPMEVRIMDAFALQRQLRASKEKDVTLVPRVHIPSSPRDESTIAKALLLYRMAAIRRHIAELKEQRKQEYENAYRDLRHMKLELKHDPENPWKEDLMSEVQLVLSNQGSWSQGNKERFVRKMHEFLSSDLFSSSGQEDDGIPQD